MRERTGTAPAGPIRTSPSCATSATSSTRSSFYYCFDAAAEHVSAVVAEVTNTPWGERHAYVMPVGERADHGTATLMRTHL